MTSKQNKTILPVPEFYMNPMVTLVRLTEEEILKYTAKPKSQGPRRSERIIKKNIMQLEMKSQLSVEVVDKKEKKRKRKRKNKNKNKSKAAAKKNNKKNKKDSMADLDESELVNKPKRALEPKHNNIMHTDQTLFPGELPVNQSLAETLIKNEPSVSQVASHSKEDESFYLTIPMKKRPIKKDLHYSNSMMNLEKPKLVNKPKRALEPKHNNIMHTDQTLFPGELPVNQSLAETLIKNEPSVSQVASHSMEGETSNLTRPMKKVEIKKEPIKKVEIKKEPIKKVEIKNEPINKEQIKNEPINNEFIKEEPINKDQYDTNSVAYIIREQRDIMVKQEEPVPEEKPNDHSLYPTRRRSERIQIMEIIKATVIKTEIGESQSSSAGVKRKKKAPVAKKPRQTKKKVIKGESVCLESNSMISPTKAKLFIASTSRQNHVKILPQSRPKASVAVRETAVSNGSLSYSGVSYLSGLAQPTIKPVSTGPALSKEMVPRRKIKGEALVRLKASSSLAQPTGSGVYNGNTSGQKVKIMPRSLASGSLVTPTGPGLLNNGTPRNTSQASSSLVSSTGPGLLVDGKPKTTKIHTRPIYLPREQPVISNMGIRGYGKISVRKDLMKAPFYDIVTRRHYLSPKSLVSRFIILNPENTPKDPDAPTWYIRPDEHRYPVRGNPLPANLTTPLVPVSYQSGEAHTESFCQRPPIKIHLRRKDNNNYIIV